MNPSTEVNPDRNGISIRHDDRGLYNIEYSAPAPGRGHRYREFIVMIGSTEIERHAGAGVTLDDVIAARQEAYRNVHETVDEENARGCDPRMPIETAANNGCLAIWEQDAIQAVLIPDPMGTPQYLVTRSGRTPSVPDTRRPSSP